MKKNVFICVIAVITTAIITACVCIFAMRKTDENKQNENSTNSNNEVNVTSNAQNNSTLGNNSNTTSNTQNNTTSNNNTSSKNTNYEEITAKYDNKEYDWIKNGKNTKIAFSEDKDGYSGLSITGIDKNSNGTYTIKGVMYKPYKVTDDELKKFKETGIITIYGEKYEERKDEYGNKGLYKAGKKEEFASFRINEETKEIQSQDQWGTCYRITDKHMQITLRKDTLVLGANEYDMQDGKGKTVEELYKTMKDFDDESGNGMHRCYNFVFKDGKCAMIFGTPYES